MVVVLMSVALGMIAFLVPGVRPGGVLPTPRPTDITYIGFSFIAHSTNIGHVAAMARAQILTVKKLIALSPEMAQAISEFRFREQIKAEAEAIRRLIKRGLEAETAPVTKATR